MPRKTSTVSIFSLALAASLVLGACGSDSGSDAAEPEGGGAETAADSGSDTTAQGSDAPYVYVFDGEGEEPADLEAVVLEDAGDWEYGIDAVDGMLFSEDGSIMYLADYRTAEPAGFLEEGLNPNPPEDLLRNGSDGYHSHVAPVLGAGYLYFADTVGPAGFGDRDRVVKRAALDTGQHETLATVKENPQLALDEDLFVFLADESITAVDTATGEQLWQAATGASPELDARYVAFTADAVAVANEDALEVFDRDTGDLLAERTIDTWFLALGADGDAFYTAERTEDTRGDLDAAAADIYRIDADGEAEKIGTTPVTDDPRGVSMQLTVTADAVLLKSDNELQALDVESGDLLWTAGTREEAFSADPEADNPLIDFSYDADDATAYLYARDSGEAAEDSTNRLLAVDIASGEILANYVIDAPDGSAGPSVDGENVVLIATNGRVEPYRQALILPRIS